MKLFGLTGGMGMGKSTSARLLAEHGIPVIDTDVIAREVVEPGQRALAEIAAVFGGDLLDADGKLRRAELAKLVFASPPKLKELEAIVHPRIRARWMAQVEEWRREGREVGVVVVPLLFETGAQTQFDAVLCVACSGATQQARLQARGWSADQIQQRLNAQWPTEKKIAASDYVLWTEGDLTVHARQIDILIERHLASRR